MNQAEIYFNQERQDDIFGDGVVSTLCLFAIAILGIPLFGYLPLVGVATGAAFVVATYWRTEQMEDEN